MRCPYCRHPDSRVVDSREQDEGQVIRRRRSCPECGRRFTTVEEATLAVIKRSGVTEPFSRAKVVSGVRRACQGRPVDEDALALLAQAVEEEIRATGAAEVPSDEVGLAILGPLRASTRSPTCASRASTRPSRSRRRLREGDRRPARRTPRAAALTVRDLRTTVRPARPTIRTQPSTHRPAPLRRKDTHMTEADVPAHRVAHSRARRRAAPARGDAVKPPARRPARSSGSTPPPACTRTPRSPGSAATSS